MSTFIQRTDDSPLGERLRRATVITEPLMLAVMANGTRRMNALRHGETARLMRLIEDRAWTDAALAYIELELPLWQVRRIVYDRGEWHCALSRQRELPDWLDGAIEARHVDLPLALLCAAVDVQAAAASAKSGYDAAEFRDPDPLYERINCENLG